MKSLKQIFCFASDAVQINAPVGASLAVVKLAELKDLIAIATMIVGTACTVLVTRHKLKSKKKDSDNE